MNTTPDSLSNNQFSEFNDYDTGTDNQPNGRFSVTYGGIII